MLTIAVLALDDVLVFDLATPIEVFGRTVLADGSPAYEVLIVGPRRTVRAGPTSLSVPHALERLVDADIIIVPGRSKPLTAMDHRALRALQQAAARGVRMASICVGAFDLAAAGVLDGLRATTHWKAAGELAKAYPAVEVDAGALFVDNGQILCSAGAAAGLDLCLHIISRDYGGVIAAEAARTAVVPLTREAGQAQYIQHDALGSIGLAATLQWIEDRASEPITVAQIASAASVSARTLNRRFAGELGMTPSTWLTRARVRKAQQLLETTELSVDQVAHASGLGSAPNLRAHFASIVGTSPMRYRTALGVSSPGHV